MNPRRGSPPKIPPPLPPRPANGKCSHCGDRPIEYRTDEHGMPTVYGKCRECHEKNCYLGTRNSYNWG